MLNAEQKDQMNGFLRQLVMKISISESQFKELKESYEAVGKYLASSLELKNFNLEIYPQGSIKLGTAIKPVSEEDDVDIDLVCEMSNIPNCWTQEKLKNAVGDCLKQSTRYRNMLENGQGGHRCWTLLYRANTENIAAKYHMDILPSVVSSKYSEELRCFSSQTNFSSLVIHITDNRHIGYSTITDRSQWPSSNPYGYAIWFKRRCEQGNLQMFANESIERVPKYEEFPMVLQSVIRLLKRHRDLMFDGNDDKPISIIITTLAARAYRGENNIYDALLNIVNNMTNYVTKRVDIDREISYIENPVDAAENFADKWSKEPNKEKCFYEWVSALKKDVSAMEKDGMNNIQQALERFFGEHVTRQLFESYAQDMHEKRNLGVLKIDTTGTLGLAGTIVKQHLFHGK